MSSRPAPPDGRGWYTRDWVQWLDAQGLVKTVLPNDPVCHRCAKPVPDAPDGTPYRVCWQCRQRTQYLRRIIPASYATSTGLTSIVWQAKRERDRAWLHWPLASLLSELFSEHWGCLERLAGGSIDVVTVIPSLRSQGSGANHLEQLVNAVQGWTLGGADWDLDLLIKTDGSTANGRRNLTSRDLFVVNPARSLTGKRVLLVDDMCTTGGTLNSAAYPLVGAGAHPPVAVTIGRQIRNDSPEAARLFAQLQGRSWESDVCAACS